MTQESRDRITEQAPFSMTQESRDRIVEQAPFSVTQESRDHVTEQALFSMIQGIARRPVAVQALLIGSLVLCSLVLFGRTLFGDAAFYARDVLHFYWPLRTAAAEVIRKLELPQWSVFTQAGLPFLADIHAGVLYPPHLLYQFVSFPRAYAWLLFLHHVAGGVGALFLFQWWGLRKVAALGGALVFMLSGYVAGLTNAVPLMAGAAYVPWVLAVLSSKLPVHFRAPLLGLVVTLQILCGDVQALLFSVLASLVLILWAEERRPTALTFLGGFGIAALISSVQLVPAWHLLSQSNRASANPYFVEEFSFHPIRLLELVAPFPFGGYLRDHPFWASFAVNGPGIWPFALSAYVGAAGATVGLLGVSKNRRSGFALTLLLLGLILALGRHGVLGQILLLAPFRFFRYPEKYLLLASLGAAALAAEGLNRICAREISMRRLRLLGVTIGAFALCAATAYVAGPRLELFAAGLLRAVAPRVQPSAALANALVAARWALVCAGSAWALVFLLARVESFRRIAGPALVAVIGLDLLLAAQGLIFTAPIELFSSRPPIVDELQRLAPTRPFRYLRDPMLGRTFDRGSEESYLKFRIWELATIRSNVAGVFGLEEVTGYGGAFSLSRWQALAFALHQEPAKLGALLNGCLALSTVRDNPYERSERFRRVLFDPASGLAVYENALCQPRLRTVGHVVPATSLEDAIRMIAAPKFDVAIEAAVEDATERTFAQGQLESVQIERRRASANVTAPPGGTFVVFATSYYPGWAARIDHQPAPAKIVNAATMGVEVPEGQHHVEFEFKDPGLKPGLALSSAGLLLSVGWLFAQRRRWNEWRARRTISSTP